MNSRVTLGEEFIQNRPALYGRLFDEGPVRRAVMPDGLKVWVVARYADAREVLSNPASTSTDVHLLCLTSQPSWLSLSSSLERPSGEPALEESLKEEVSDDLGNCCQDSCGENLRLIVIELSDEIRRDKGYRLQLRALQKH